jgi:hypothetical protein
MNPWEEYEGTPTAAAPANAAPWEEFAANPAEPPPTEAPAPQVAEPAAPAVPAQTVQAAQGAERSLGQNVMRALGLFGRAGVNTATGLGQILADPLVGASNMLTGRSDKLPSQAINDVLTNLGLPQPETTGEKVGMLGTSLLAGGVKGGIDPLMRGLTAKMVPIPRVTPKHLETIKEGAKLGYQVSPAIGERGIVSRSIETMANQPLLQQQMAVRNQKLTDALVSKEIGAPLDAVAINSAINRTYEVGYAPIEALPRVTTGGIYRRKLAEIAIKHGAGTEASAPHAPVKELVKQYSKTAFTGPGIMQDIRNLRASATTAFRTGDAQLGKANRDIANALEDAIELNLSAAGRAGEGLMQQFRNARQLIAKQTLVLDHGLVEGTGHVDAHKIGAQVAKDRSGKYITGVLRTVGKFANAAKPLTLLPSKPPPLMSHWEQVQMGTGIAGSMGINSVAQAIAGASGLQPLAMMIAARPVAALAGRQALMSRPGQAALLAPGVKDLYGAMLASPNLPSGINAMPAGIRQLGQYGLFGPQQNE